MCALLRMQQGKVYLLTGQRRKTTGATIAGKKSQRWDQEPPTTAVSGGDADAEGNAGQKDGVSLLEASFRAYHVMRLSGKGEKNKNHILIRR